MINPPPNRTINIASGGTALVGRSSPITGGSAGKPAWLRAAAPAIGQIVEIPGTAGFGGATPAYSGVTFDRNTGEILIGLAGGHGDGGDNRFTSYNPRDDVPKWIPRKAPSTNQVQNVPYYPDGTPAARHLGQMMQLVPGTDHVIWPGARSLYGSAYTSLNASAYNLLTNQYEAASFLPDVPNGCMNGGANVDYDDELWVGVFGAKYNKTTKTWGPGATGVDVGPMRYPWATNKAGREVFGMTYSDGEVLSAFPGVHTAVMRNGVKSFITINPSAALTQFTNDQPLYTAMDFDSVNGNYVLMDLDTGHYYKVIPNSGNFWDLTLFTPTGALPPTKPGGSNTSYGACCRCHFDPVLGGFVFSQFLSTPTNQLFLRTV